MRNRSIFLLASTLLLSPAEGGDHLWFLGEHGKDCVLTCRMRGNLVCSEAGWGVREGSPFKDASIECSKHIEGDFYEGPARFTRNGVTYCGTGFAERKWSKGGYSVARPHCTRVASLEAQRLCPCEIPTQNPHLGGVATWGKPNSRWAVLGRPGLLSAGVTSLASTSTLITDIYTAVRKNTTHFIFHGEHITTSDVQSARLDPFDTVLHFASTDLSFVMVYKEYTTGTVKIKGWRSGNPTKLPYYDAQSKGYNSGSKWYVNWWKTAPDSFGEVIPESVQTAVETEAVHDIATTRAAVAILFKSGKVVSWGDKESGGDMNDVVLANVVEIHATRAAFTVLLSTGSVHSWGNTNHGGSIPASSVALLTDVVAISSTEASFASLTSSQKIVTWGMHDRGGNQGITFYSTYKPCIDEYTQVTTEHLCEQYAVMMKLTYTVVEEGDKCSVTNDLAVTWGAEDVKERVCYKQENLSPPEVSVNIRGIYSTRKSFLAVTDDGDVTVWPNPVTNWKVYPLLSPSVVHTSSEVFIVYANDTLSFLPGLGGGLDFTPDMYSTLPGPIPNPPMTQPASLTTSIGAVSVQYASGSVVTAKTEPDLLTRFYRLEGYGCYWEGYQPPRDYEVLKYSHTAEECAQRCLEKPGCTGFEFPVPNGEYCAPWYRGACTYNGSVGWHGGGVRNQFRYDLYTVREYVAKIEPDDSWDNQDFTPSQGDEICSKSAVTPQPDTTDMDECKDGCLNETGCDAVEQDTSLGGCSYVHFINKTDASMGAAAGNGLCWVKKRTDLTPSYAKIELLVEGFQAIENRTANSSETTFTLSLPAPLNETTMQFRVLTSNRQPAYDPTSWVILLDDVALDLPANFTRVPLMRNVYTEFVTVSIPGSTGVSVTVTFRPVSIRGFYYHVLNPEVNVTSSLSDCSYACSVDAKCTFFEPDNCLGYYFQDTGSGDNPPTAVESPKYIKSGFDFVSPMDVDDYGETTENVSARYRGIVPTRRAFAGYGASTGVVSWGAEDYGGNSTDTVLGEHEWLVEGTSEEIHVSSGMVSFAVLRMSATGHNECQADDCSEAVFTDVVWVPNTHRSSQLCLEPTTASWTEDDFTCLCTNRPGTSFGHPADCRRVASVSLLPLLLLLLPSAGFIVWALVIRRTRKEQALRHVEGLSDMYRLHATDEEEGALKTMLNANKGNEIKLLSTLIPTYEVRCREVRLFLLWQRRLSETTVPTRKNKRLPYDLLRWVQAMCFGPDVLRKPGNLQPTPFGYLMLRSPKVTPKRRRCPQGPILVPTSPPRPHELREVLLDE
eukprot:TRINITY_DN9118_c5_g1_i1.p1 TRINITY_DN9118_c5_g1~~TRINITY_DN9118_c5_g1_i1.p1  ORF type:complete len:1288 (+),score=170.72 TRINITY_DN9118_c5_g1_i1:60-3923(+)